MTTISTAEAPHEADGDKILFVVWDNSGVNAEALLRAINEVTLNGEPVAHLGVASHKSSDTDSGYEPLMLVGGSDGLVIRELRVSSYGTLLVGGAGTPGTGDGNVITVQGDPLGVPIPTSDSEAPTTFPSFSGIDITSETTLWTPTSGKKFCLKGFVVTQTVATGDITLRDGTGGSTILVIPATPVGQSLYVPLGAKGILSVTTNNPVTAQGASTETISGFLIGTEE
jgi:hypothetical protein